MQKRLKKFINQKQEIIVILIITFLISLILYFKGNMINIYNTAGLNSLILGVFGTLFGLLLTSYAILFGLIPSLSVDLLETEAMKSVNFRFFLSLVANLLVIILGFAIIFVGGDLQSYLIYAQLWLVVFLISMFLLLILYLYFLFGAAKNKEIEDKTKNT